MNELEPENAEERRPATKKEMAFRVAAFAGALLLLAIGFLPVLPFAIYFWTLRCDEMCAGNTYADRGWQGDPGAWQWDLQLVIAAAAVMTAAFAVWRGWPGNWRTTWRAIAAAMFGYASWAAFLYS